MGANKNDGWTHRRDCLCYHDNQCQLRPTRFYPRYLQKQQFRAFNPTGFDTSSTVSLDLHGNEPCCASVASSSFGDLGTGSLKRQKWGSLISLNPGAVSLETKSWKSTSLWSLPDAKMDAGVDSDLVTGRELRNERHDASVDVPTVRAYKWQPSYSSGCGTGVPQGHCQKGYSHRRTGDKLEGSRENAHKGIGHSVMRWLRKLGQKRDSALMDDTRDKSENPFSLKSRSVININSKVAEEIMSCYDASLSELFVSKSRDGNAEGITSILRTHSSISDQFCDQKTCSLPSLKDKLSYDETKYCPEPLSRSVGGLSESDGVDETGVLFQGDDRGPASGLSAALHHLLRRDHLDMTSQSADDSTGGGDSKHLMRNRRMSTPHPIRSRAAQSVCYPQACQRHLKRAHSAPELIDPDGRGLKAHRKQDIFRVSLSTAGDLALPSQNYSSDDDSEDSLSYGIVSMPGSSLSLQHQAALEEIFEVNEMTTYAEALWDHVTMDPEELGFRAGDVIQVSDTRDKNWWYGHITDKHGWFPASFVRLRANQVEIIAEDASILVTSRQHSRESVSQSQARANVVNEIVQAEREYVRHLRDVIQGYVEKCRKRPEMFPQQKMTSIFSNIMDIYHFSVRFLKDLELNIDTEQPHQSKLGKVFIKHRDGFKIYSEYCNNHPTAQEELRTLQKNKKYTHFFEACRLLQDMINLPLEGFLLAPVQKICKYPLQLRELLKYTPRCHADHADIKNAHDAMHGIAVMINERKRKMESIEKLAEWQLTVDDWQGPDLLDHSSELIYSGEMTKVNSSGWHQERVFFLFDHQLIYCKKDLLWRDLLMYKGRIDLDNCIIKALSDDKDPVFNINVKNAIRIYNKTKGKWYLLYCRSSTDRERWFAAFQEERRRVDEDKKNGFNLAEFRSKAHLPQSKTKAKTPNTRYREHAKKQKKKQRGHHSKNADKQPIIASEDATTPETPEAQDSSRRWMMFGNRKPKT
ncbi:hypothetical protein LSH36_24g01012 [Paralvinella palmiformis]|uniref:Rho guanine nucleotide exchange factor 4 n=1 Tax=Paralvinella palmiformis TaxID=53620 RepID=A0AAD9KAJ5_9ANNE|nr:hypothetical protein LSH36_24g01012 [Paralvinella palmiformis]